MVVAAYTSVTVAAAACLTGDGVSRLLGYGLLLLATTGHQIVATNQTLFSFEPQGNQTVVTWDMTGKKNLMAKAFHLFVNMDKMVGGQFDQGLTQMKKIAEGAGRT